MFKKVRTETYVVSYFAPHGEYAFDANYFANSGVTNGPLHALANSEDPGGNGVFHYGNTSSFPSQTFNAANYWVDVVFTHLGLVGKSLVGRSLPDTRSRQN